MTMTIGMITVDSADPGPLAQWWAAATGGTIQQENDGWFYVLSLPEQPQLLAFQKVDDPTPGKNRVHLDLTAPDLDAEVAALIEAGATEVAQRSMGDFRWVTLADPQGNQFCVADAPH